MERVKEGLKLIDENDHLFTDAQIVLAHCSMAGGETAEARAHYECAISAALATPEEIALAESCLRDIAEQEGT